MALAEPPWLFVIFSFVGDFPECRASVPLAFLPLADPLMVENGREGRFFTTQPQKTAGFLVCEFVRKE
jgi:hypothetical protein